MIYLKPPLFLRGRFFSLYVFKQTLIMNKIYYLAFSLCFSLLMVGCAKFDPADSANGQDAVISRADRAAYRSTVGAVEGVLYVKLKRGVAAQTVSYAANGGVRTGIQKVDALAAELGVESITRVFPYSAKHNAKHVRHGLDRWYKVTLPEGNGVRGAALGSMLEQFEMLGDVVEHVETAKAITMYGADDRVVPYSGSTTGNSSVRAGDVVLPFNDRLLPRQWSIVPKDDGNIMSVASINALDAWQVTCGDPRIIVSVVDGGIKYDHLDLKDNMWVNQAERDGKLGVDDDGNGYVDDEYGYNFADDKGKIVPLSHSTHVAGIIGAVSNNGIGISGIAGGSGHGDGARLMSCQIAANRGVITGEVPAKAIIYGADNGAVISQNSWGYSGAWTREQIVEDAIDYFIAEAGNATDFPNSLMRGGIVFFAAGNNNSMELYYPEAYESVVAVAATDHRAARATYSNYGDWVDISAPGGSEFSLTPEMPDESMLSCIVSKTDAGACGFMFGTSMACPVVSGVAALMVAANPGITAAQLKTKILGSVRSLEVTSPDSWQLMGSGLLDASLTLKATNDGVAPQAIGDLVLAENPESQTQPAYNLKWTVPAENGVDRVTRYTVYYAAGLFADGEAARVVATGKKVVVDQFRWMLAGSGVVYALPEECLSALSSGHCTFVVTAEDGWGNVSPVSNVAQYMHVAQNAIQLERSVVSSQIVVNLGREVRTVAKQVSVVDRAGRTVLSRQFDAFAAEGTAPSQLEINVAHLAAGNYTLVFNSVPSGRVTLAIAKM